MPNITIIQNKEIIAHHTTESHLSHYGQPVWIIKNENPDPGLAVFKELETDTLFDIEIVGVVGGWLVIKQPPTEDMPQLLAGIIWSDGGYYGDLIQTRDGNNFVSDAEIDALNSGNFMVKGTVAVDAFDEGSPLGSVLS